ncbi:MAG: hypothetical protein M3268_02150 [Acidobacteriota bacterium]|nr:hypothetical protein [Acidobacteriota bacterium]
MKAADGDADSALAQARGNIERTRKLIRLHADEHHHPVARLFDQGGNFSLTNVRVRFVEGVDFKLNVRA